MTIELFLFLVLGAVAIGCSVAMLLSKNAVHSALFLILTMACIALLFLWLEAPFLAMVQIAVYAGAIMVLFLFVIMLLGAESAEVIEPADAPKVRWVPVMALILAASFFVMLGLVIFSGNIDSQAPSGASPMLRLANFAANDAGEGGSVQPRLFDVYVNDALVFPEVQFGEVSDFISMQPGDYTIALVPTGLDAGSAITTADVALEPGEVETVIVYGESPVPAVSVVSDNLVASENRTGRVTVFNAYSGVPAVSLVDFEFDSSASGSTRINEAFINELPQGQVSSPLLVDEGDIEWTFVDAANNNQTLFRLRDFEIDRGTSQLIVLTGERVANGEATIIRPLAVPLVTPVIPAFGSPQGIGHTLFTTYMLPFQAVALLLLVSMVGAIVLTHKEPVGATRRRDVRRKVSRPLTSVISAQTGHDVLQPTTEESPQTSGD